MSLKIVYIVELRKGWLSHRMLDSFDDIHEADWFLKNWRRENWEMLQANPDLSLELSVGKAAA